MVESSLLSQYELVTSNIDNVMGVWIFRRRAQNTKFGKNWMPRFWFIFSKSGKIKLVQTFLLKNYGNICAGVRFGKNRFTGCQENKLLRSAQPISQPNLAQCSLCWQFEDQKDMYLVLQGFSAIHPVTVQSVLLDHFLPPGTPYPLVRSTSKI